MSLPLTRFLLLTGASLSIACVPYEAIGKATGNATSPGRSASSRHATEATEASSAASPAAQSNDSSGAPAESDGSIASSVSSTLGLTVNKAEKSRSPEQRIRDLLRTADRERLESLSKPGHLTFHVVTEKFDESGDKLHRTYKLLSYDDEDRMEKAREGYEEILTMDGGNVQAVLGLADLALMESVTLRNSIASIEFSIATGSALTAKETAVLQRKAKLLQRRLDSAVAAAQNKFKTVLVSNPQEAVAHLGIAIALTIEKSWPAAVAKFDLMEKSGLVPAHNRSIFYVWYGFALQESAGEDAALAKFALAAELQEPYSWALWARDRVEEIEVYR